LNGYFKFYWKIFVRARFFINAQKLSRYLLLRVIENMSFLRCYAFSSFKYLSILIFASFLASCSVSQPEAELFDDNLISSSALASDGESVPNDERVSDNDSVPGGEVEPGGERVSDNNQGPDGGSTPDNERVSDNGQAPDGGSTSNGEPVSDNEPVPDNVPAPSSNAKKALKVSWNAPLKREDSSTLDLTEIAEYRVYYGAKTGDYKHVIVVDGSSTLQVEQSGVPVGKYYVAVTAVDRDGRESKYSQEITVII